MTSTLLSRTAEDALREHGFDGRRLLKLAQRVASDVVEGRVKGISSVPHIGDKRDDLVSAMYERALRRSLTFDPALTNGKGDHFQSYLAKHMEHAARDFFRSKAQGFVDHRYHDFNPVVLTAIDDDPDPDVDFEALISERRLGQWQQAADTVGMTLAEFVVVTLDRASRQVLRTAA